MTIVETPTRSGLRHEALFYGSDDEFVAASLPYLRDGLDRGDRLVAAVTRPNAALLRDALGADAGQVGFIDRDEWYRRPVVTVAGWQRLVDRTADGTRLRILGEVAFGDVPERQTSWTRYESALNELFAAAPAWIVCPYDTRTLPANLLADARRTHPVVGDPDPHVSDTYEEPRALLSNLPQPPPRVSGDPAVDMPLHDATDVGAARSAVRAAAATWSEQRREDLLLVVSEMAANALRHGRGRRRLRLWNLAGSLVCEVSDDGSGPPDPLAGYLAPARELPGGRGLWIAHQLCDEVAVDSGEHGASIWLTVTAPS
jgi:anti-sigma regulatory factor (Ser/Thr protein kinase)